MYHNFLILVFCLLYHTVSAKLECFPSDREIEYQNDIACDLDVECPKGYGINAVAAKAGYLSQPGSDPPVPISETDDHQWYWICTKIGDWKVKNEYCYNFELGNDIGDLVAFRCPEEYYIGGLSTSVNESVIPIDHKWNVRCCRQEGLCISDCQLSDYLNDFGGDIDYCLPEEFFLVGIYSHIDNPDPNNYQRRWKVGSCRLERCDFHYYASKVHPSHSHHGKHHHPYHYKH